MKNWKFVKVENKDTPELREKLRDIDEQIKNWEHAKGIGGVEKANAQKTIDDLKKERSKIQQEITTGNESIDKQEWSMFKGLAKDAEKEVGNNTTRGIDYIALDVPLFVRLLEFAKEDAKSDMDLHTVTENILRIQQTKNETNTAGGFLTMKDYADIVDLNENTKEVGNETAEEKKFGKVMREFDRGELKSSSGETVTNPEQAKAIAYSESKDVNNLKRARNAIKTKNADVTLWKDNDTVYIKEDGHVQYLENNSFVVDEDKYDSQEKAIEDLTKKGYHKK